MAGLKAQAALHAGSVIEHASVFDCKGSELVGIVAQPARPATRIGVVIVVGGPQYRTGSHRQFTLLARHLAQHGIASLRFDYRGYGDSAGQAALGVLGIEDDLQAATNHLLAELPALQAVVFWGLCGAASAAAMYAATDTRVAGLVMLNPWVRTEVGLAKAQLRHYYLGRLAKPEFWRRILAGEVAIGASLRGLGRSIERAAGFGRHALGSKTGSMPATEQAPDFDKDTLPQLMLSSLEQGGLPVLVVLSGDADLTANEFRDLVARSARWRRWLDGPKVKFAVVTGSNHTFARAEWRAEVQSLTTDWVSTLELRLGAALQTPSKNPLT